MKQFVWIIVAAAALSAVSCSVDQLAVKETGKPDMSRMPEDIGQWEAEVNADFERVIAVLGTDEALTVMNEYDAKYGTNLAETFLPEISAARASGKGSSNYPPLTDLPVNRDGAIYLSGGATDLIGNVIGWVAPKNLPGGYYHGGALDLNKADPNNPDVPCVQTAIPKGAGYETVNDWRGKVNVCVLNPKTTLDAAKLDNAQNQMDYYCKPSNTNMEYGFFKNAINIFNVVTKEDMYTWYCTKVAWHVYNRYGLDIDSNSTLVDFTKSGLYGLVSAYYKTIYFYNSSKANAAINAYVADARKKIVLAEEIMLSPHLVKVYEKIRE